MAILFATKDAHGADLVSGGSQLSPVAVARALRKPPAQAGGSSGRSPGSRPGLPRTCSVSELKQCAVPNTIAFHGLFPRIRTPKKPRFFGVRCRRIQRRITLSTGCSRDRLKRHPGRGHLRRTGVTSSGSKRTVQPSPQSPQPPALTLQRSCNGQGADPASSGPVAQP